MNAEDLRALFDYGCWANRKLFPSVAQLSIEEFTRSLPGSEASIRSTLVHMLSAQWGWASRCGGPPRPAPLKAEDFPTPSALLEAWARVEDDLRTFYAALRDEDVDRPVTFQIGSYPEQSLSVGILLRHGENHGVHHRGQVSLRLRLLGQTPGDFDLLFYHMERPSAQR